MSPFTPSGRRRWCSQLFFCFFPVPVPVEVVDVVAAPIDGTTPTQANRQNREKRNENVKFEIITFINTLHRSPFVKPQQDNKLNPDTVLIYFIIIIAIPRRKYNVTP